MQIPDSDEYNDTLVQFDVTALIYVRALRVLLAIAFCLLPLPFPMVVL